MKKRSTIGFILQIWAGLNAIAGAVCVLYILSQPDKGMAIPVAMGAAIFIGFGVVVLLGIAELLHAVMRTAAATEAAAETLQQQAMQSIRDSMRAARPAAAVAGGSRVAAAEFEEAPWQGPGEVKCEVCNNFFGLPARRTPEVTCPHCGVDMAWPG